MYCTRAIRKVISVYFRQLYRSGEELAHAR
jgi:hypothetical protein